MKQRSVYFLYLYCWDFFRRQTFSSHSRVPPSLRSCIKFVVRKIWSFSSCLIRTIRDTFSEDYHSLRFSTMSAILDREKSSFRPTIKCKLTPYLTFYSFPVDFSSRCWSSIYLSEILKLWAKDRRYNYDFRSWTNKTLTGVLHW